MKFIVHLKEDYLLNGKKRTFQSNLMIQIHLFDDSIEFLNLKRIHQMKKRNSLIQILNSTQTTFIQNNQIEKIHLFAIDFILSQIVVFIIFINLKQKWWNQWIDYFWIILVKKRIFCLFNCFLGWRKERKWKVFLCFSNCFFGYKTFFFVDQKFQNPRLRIP